MPQNKPLKILYLITLSELGGAQKYVLDLAVNLSADKKFKIIVAYGGKPYDSLAKHLQVKHVGNHYLKHLQRPINFYADLLAFIQIFKLIKKIQPDIIHLNSTKAGVLGALAAKLAGVKKITYTVHGLVLNEPLGRTQKIIYWLAEWFSAKCKTHFICVSDFDKQSLLKYKLTRPHKITVVHNGIQLNQLNFLTRQTSREKLTQLLKQKINSFNFNLNQPRYYLIGTIANFYPSKGLIYLIQAIHLLKVEQPRLKIKLLIVGDGPNRRQLTEFIQRRQLSQVIWLPGILENATRYLKAFDIFVLPSIKEGLSYTLIEALAAQLPIIATHVGGNPEIIENNVNGLLVPPASARALAQAIQKTINQPELTKKFQYNNRGKINAFDLTHMLGATLKIYKA